MCILYIMRKGTKRLKRTSTKRKSIKRKNKNTTIRRRVSNNKHTRRLKKIKGGFYFNKYANMFEKYLQNNNKQVVKLYSEQKSCSDPLLIDNRKEACPYIPQYIDELMDNRFKFTAIEKTAHPELKKVLDTIEKVQENRLTEQIAKITPLEQPYEMMQEQEDPESERMQQLDIERERMLQQDRVIDQAQEQERERLRNRWRDIEINQEPERRSEQFQIETITPPNNETNFTYMTNLKNEDELALALKNIYKNIELTTNTFVKNINGKNITRDDFKTKDMPRFLQTIESLLSNRTALFENYFQENRLTSSEKEKILQDKKYKNVDPSRITSINVNLRADPTIKFKGNFMDFLKWLNIQSTIMG